MPVNTEAADDQRGGTPMMKYNNPEQLARIIKGLNLHTRRRCCQFILHDSGTLFTARCPFEVVANTNNSGIEAGKAYWVEDVVVLKEDLETYFLVNNKYYHLSYFSLSNDWLRFNRNPSRRREEF